MHWIQGVTVRIGISLVVVENGFISKSVSNILRGGAYYICPGAKSRSDVSDLLYQLSDHLNPYANSKYITDTILSYSDIRVKGTIPLTYQIKQTLLINLHFNLKYST